MFPGVLGDLLRLSVAMATPTQFRYDGYLGRNDETLLERVSRKAIRPYPPLTEFANNGVLGEVVEVLDDFSWKMVTVTRILDEKRILVRLLGSSLEFKVGEFDIQLRQLWQDNRWMLIGKSSGDRKHDERTLKCNQKSRIHIKGTSRRIHADAQADFFPLRSVEKLQDSDVVSHRAWKRQALGNLQIEECVGGGKKFSAIDKEGELNHAIAVSQFLSPEQVEAAAFPRKIVGEKIMHSSFDSRTGFPEMDAERRKLTSAAGCSSAMDLDLLDLDSVTSSVGRCSITNSSPSNLYCHSGFIKDNDVFRSDAESFNEWGYEEGNSVLPVT